MNKECMTMKDTMTTLLAEQSMTPLIVQIYMSAKKWPKAQQFRSVAAHKDEKNRMRSSSGDK